MVTTMQAELGEGVKPGCLSPSRELSGAHETEVTWAASIGEQFCTVLPHESSRLLLAEELDSLPGYPEVLTIQGVKLVRVGNPSWLLDEGEEAVFQSDSVQKLTETARESAVGYFRKRAGQLRQSLSEAVRRPSFPIRHYRRESVQGRNRMNEV